MIVKNLDEVEQKEVVPGFKGRFIHSAQMTLAYWNIEKRASLPEHSHMHEQITHVLEGTFTLTIEGEQKTLKPGDVAVIPADVRHSGRALTRCTVIDVFYPDQVLYGV